AELNQEDGCGMLKDDADDDVVPALDAVDENAGRAHAEVGSPIGDLCARVHTRPSFANRDIESVLAVKALFEGGIVAGELELVFPLQLKRDIIQRVRRML